MKMIFISDLDRTLARLTPLQKKFINEKGSPNRENLNWGDYYSEVGKQTPILENVRFLKTMVSTLTLCKMGETFMFSTSRNEKYRKETEKWIEVSLGELFASFPVYMRREGDYRPGSAVKEDNLKIILDKNQLHGEHCLVFEDDEDCSKMYRRKGCFVILPLEC